MCFVDLKAAFDKVVRELLYEIFEYYQFSPKDIRMMKLLYKNHTVRIKRDGHLGANHIVCTTGVKQGCPLSPLEFNVVINFSISKMDLGDGIKIIQYLDPEDETGSLDDVTKVQNRVRHLLLLLFADDIALVDETLEGLQKKVQVMDEIFTKYCLEMSIPKTKLLIMQHQTEKDKMKPGPLQPLQIMRGSKKLIIEQVKEFKYLGCWLFCNNSSDIDIENNIKNSSQALGATRLNKYLFSRKISRRRKLRAFMTFIYPRLAFGAETWVLNNKNRAALNTFWMKQMRKIYGCTKFHRIPSKTILNTLYFKSRIYQTQHRAAPLELRWPHSTIPR